MILLKQGKVVYSGPPSELNRDCDSFLDLLASHNKSLPPPVPVRLTTTFMDLMFGHHFLEDLTAGHQFFDLLSKIDSEFSSNLIF